MSRTCAVLLLLLAASLFQSALALAIQSDVAVLKRQDSTANNTYAPYNITCPSTSSLVRNVGANQLGSGEADYIQRHLTATQSQWSKWLSSKTGPNLDGSGGISGGVSKYTSNVSHLPRVGIAISGGGLRAMLNGVGYLQGLDSRNQTAVERGTGGFLQLASYVAGISGGSWTVGSLAINDWPTPQILHDTVYNLSSGLFSTPTSSLNQDSYYTDIVSDLKAKAAEGYQVSLIDYWGRLLSGHLVDSQQTSTSNSLQWSDVQKTSTFTSASYPFPLVTTIEVIDGSTGSGGNGTIWESNPLETGSWDKGIAAFVPTNIWGSTLNNGLTDSCEAGYDNFGFTVGLSSAIFNSVASSTTGDIPYTTPTDPNNLLGGIVGALAQAAGLFALTILQTLPTIPNPFKGWSDASLVSAMDNITLVDGGEDGQGIPFVPLLQPARGLDVILAIDSSSDTSSNWPAGSSLHNTYSRYANSNGNLGLVPMPKIPSVNTFINEELNTRPTFFGCDASEDVINTSASNTKAPIIIYIPNYPWTYLTNFSTDVFQLSNEQSQSTIDNAVQSATLGGITGGSKVAWPTCLACASLQRSFERSKTAVPSKCQECMAQYCWKGTTNDTAPTQDYLPQVGTPEWVTQGAKQKSTSSSSNSSGGSNGSNGAGSASNPFLILFFSSLALSFIL